MDNDITRKRDRAEKFTEVLDIAPKRYKDQIHTSHMCEVDVKASSEVLALWQHAITHISKVKGKL